MSIYRDNMDDHNDWNSSHEVNVKHTQEKPEKKPQNDSGKDTYLLSVGMQDMHIVSLLYQSSY